MKSSKPWLYAAARAFDGAAGMAFGRSGREQPADPRRILMSNVGHLGDALLSLGVPGALRRLFPRAQLDVLVSSDGAGLFAGLADVSRVFVHDSLLLRSGTNGNGRGWNGGDGTNGTAAAHGSVGYERASPALLRERAYDIALELRSYVPNSIPLLARSGARYICGFGSAGFSFLLDRVVPHVDGEHEIDRFGRVLRALSGERGPMATPVPTLDHLFALANGNGRRSPYVVLHPGTRRRRKRWTEDGWLAVARSLAADGVDLIVTGSASERSWLESKFGQVRAEILAGELDVAALAKLYGKASAFIGVDSFPAHLAATAGARHVVVLWHEYADPDEWAPVGGGRVSVLPGASKPETVLRVIAEEA